MILTSNPFSTGGAKPTRTADMKILVIEDEKKSAIHLERGLRESGYDVAIADHGDQGLQMALAEEFDAIVLDVMLPGLDGWGVMTELRKAGRQTPVLFLTARDGVEDRVKGLELGADDYLVKPFAFSELLARIKSLLRRVPQRQPEILRVGDLEIDLYRHRASRAGKKLELTPKEFSLLSLLVRHLGEPLAREKIATEVWDVTFESDTNVVDVHVRRLRSKLDDPYDKKLIQTVRGVGYVIHPQP
jgi:two-component system copper resistance phosphate regulon response regulator CusR